ncbi:MAG: DUF2851 family protein, partial [Chloroflexi bacterium]|nr:DUF2851 family protein [Chloroflexota bacterium]
NKVVLHVTLWEDNVKKILLQNGAVIPNFSLYPVMTHSWDQILYRYKNNQEMQPRCLIQPHSTPDIILKAGEQRFQLKVESFLKRLNNEDSSQVIYSGIMRALGYSKNKEQFELLSKRIPLTILKNNTQGFQPDLQLLILEALLLGAGGLLFNENLSFINDIHREKLYGIWNSTCYKNILKKPDWNLCKVRPDNYPGRRLIGAACLINRFTPDNFLKNIIIMIKTACSMNQVKYIENGFIVTENGITYIGRGRAREIIVNIILPFITAWAKINSDKNLELYATTLYDQYPGLNENYITLLMAKQLSIKNPNSAKVQQGLLYIFDGFCRERRCGECRTNLAPDPA